MASFGFFLFHILTFSNVCAKLILLHILIAQFQGNTLGKSVFSRLEFG